MIPLGWVIWSNDQAHRPTHGSGWRQRKAPARIYPSEARALTYGSEGMTARQVFLAPEHATAEQVLTGATIEVIYTNYRGETALRRIFAKYVWFGATIYHPVPQLLIHAVDMDLNVVRDFALRDTRLA